MGAEFDFVPPRELHVDATFGANGYLAQRFAGYMPRPGQVALAHAVDTAIEDRKHLLAEGPTGTGKSLAYAVPATFHAATTGKTVVIVTANIALQEQLVEKDLPLLAEILPWSFTFALMKGRNNYLCMDRVSDESLVAATRQGALFKGAEKTGPSVAFTRHEEASAEERRHLPIVQAWAEEQIAIGSSGGATGDKSTIPIEPIESVWRRFSVSSDECKGQACEHANACFANVAFGLARKAQVVVTNYHLFFANLAIYADGARANGAGLDRVLPPFDVAILDECHKAADIARDFFGFRVTSEGIKRAGSRMPRAESLARAGKLLFSRFAEWKRNREVYNIRFKESFAALPEYREVDALLGEAIAHCNEEVEKLGNLATSGAMTEQQVRKRLAEIELAYRRAMTTRMNLQHAAALEGANQIYFLEEDERGRITLVSRLVRPSEALATALFEKTKNRDGADGAIEIGPPVSVVCTSATLATGKGKSMFDYAAEEFGVKHYASLVAESPFNWREQCLFVLPPMPEPNDATFADEVARNFLRIIQLARGRTLGLFTSRRVLNHVYEQIAGKGFRVLKQGDASRTKLIAEFKADVHSVLLGNDSFWAGVDVPGESLSCVVIDRLPFPTPDDPVLDAISEQMAGGSKKAFFTYSIPRAILAFKQGFGRGVRTTTDRVVVVCLDARIASKPYGKQFLVALPDVLKSQRLDIVGEFLNEPRAAEERIA